MEEGDYQGRVNYTGDNENIHTLTIRNLRLGDSRYYRFRFITDHPDGMYAPWPGILLSVTGNFDEHEMAINAMLFIQDV